MRNVCEDCATEEEKEKVRQEKEENQSPFTRPLFSNTMNIGLDEGQICVRCGEVNSVGRKKEDVHVCGKGTKGMIVQLDGSTVKHVEQGRNKMVKGRNQLWMYLGPLQFYGDFPANTLEIRRNSKIRDQERECDLVAKTVEVDEESGMTYVEFLVKDSSPITKKVTYSYDQILEGLEEGSFITKETLNKRAEEALEKARAMSGSDKE